MRISRLGVLSALTSGIWSRGRSIEVFLSKLLGRFYSVFFKVKCSVIVCGCSFFFAFRYIISISGRFLVGVGYIR